MQLRLSIIKGYFWPFLKIHNIISAFHSKFSGYFQHIISTEKEILRNFEVARDHASRDEVISCLGYCKNPI